MISLEKNFYHFVEQNYCQDGTSVLFVPRHPGDKLIGAFAARAKLLPPRWQLRPIWMYDQEPVTDYCTHQLLNLAREFFTMEEVEYLQQISFAQTIPLLQTGGRTHHFPIWCHSELLSAEIDQLTENGFATCYYWYHALISLDWFRWHHYSQRLMPRNKADAPFRFLLYARAFDGSRTYRQRMVDGLSVHRSMIGYDWDANQKVSSDASAEINITDAENSAVHLVAETLFEESKLHLTEKVFKPIVMSQPFLLWAPAGSLQYLRNYGFRTFSHVWSEDYDTMTDPAHRMSRLLEIVDELATMPKDQFSRLYEKCLETINHNRQWFFSQTFRDRCWHELDVNFQGALLQRHELEQQSPGGILCRLAGSDPRIYRMGYFKNVIRFILQHLDDHKRRQVLAAYPHFND